METKTPSEALRMFKQTNKVAREKKAIRLGFSSAEAYIQHLEEEIARRAEPGYKYNKAPEPTPTIKTKKEPVKTTKTKATKSTTWSVIHVVDVLDASGSMMGLKFSHALEGINSGVADLRADKAKVIYTYTLCEFSDTVLFKHTLRPLNEVTNFVSKTRSSTALFDAIGLTVDKLSKAVGKNDKVLVNIYTDGQENASKHYSADKISSYIEDYSKKGWTFTFIGTESDVTYAQNVLKFHTSNTLVYDGSAKGLEYSLTKTREARTNYSTSVEKGEDVSKGFYKDITTKK